MKRATMLTAVAVVAVLLYVVLKPAPRSASTALRFVSLAWQEQTLATNRAIVGEWNAVHPDRPVEYVQGTWNSLHDYLITAFETGDVPDVFHYESSVIVDFAARGFLTDLAPSIDPEMRADIIDAAWEAVRRPDGQVCGIPFLLESFIGLYNKDLFERAGITPPTMEKPWTWDDLRAAAKKLTVDTTGDGVTDRWGVAVGLRNSANIIMNLSVSFGGSFFRKEGNRYVVSVGASERDLLSTIHDMLYRDSSTAPSSIGQSGPAMIPGFFGGKYAMVIGIGAWSRQQLVENAPKGFRWGVFPPLKALTQNTGMSAQTLSVPRGSKHREIAMEFIKFMLSTRNMARLAQSDWMLPARRSCLDMPAFHEPSTGWDITTASARYLTTGIWMGVPGYVEWKSRVANPVLQAFFSGRLGLDEAVRRIEEESNAVLSRYQ